MFERFFRKKAKPRAPIRDVEALTAALSEPAVHIVTGESPTRSHFGGLASLPPDVAWPTHNGRRLEFLARLSLPELQRALPLSWLPESGALLFFYDLDEQPWGFDPKHRGQWAVLHVDDLAAPQGPVDVDADGSALPVPYRYIECQPIRTLPTSERGSIEQLNFDDDELEELQRLADLPFSGRPKHQIGGFPAPVQGDAMELECQLASHGIYCGDGSERRDPRARELAAGAQDWRLLLQLDTDDELELTWGDAGMVYFWIHEDAARKGRFSDAWVVLQCY